jgi:hypothetical protein
MISTPIN